MATQISELVECVVELYNDPKQVRLTTEKAVKHLNQAIAEVAGLRPTEFTETVSVPLVAGALQALPPGYCFIEVNGVSGTADDTSTTTVGSQLDTVMADRFGGTSCADQGGDPEDYAPQSATGVSFSPGGFKVSPPAPEGVTATVDVIATNSSPDLVLAAGESPLPRTYDAQLVDYALYRAHSVQIESAYHVAQAQRYCDKFYAALNVDYQSASRVKSGYNYGRTGVGNDNLGAQRDLRGTAL